MEVRAKNGKGPLLFEWDSDTRTIGLVRKDMLLQKEYVADPISKKRKKNRGELPQYFVENSHEAIIPMETWQYVQGEMARRRELGCFANKSLTLNCFSTKIKCGKCGRSFVRSTRTNRAKISQLGEHYIFWGCTSKKKKNCPSCKNGTIRETVLMEECAKVLDIPEFDEEIFTEKVAQITAPETGTLIFDFTDGHSLPTIGAAILKKKAGLKNVENVPRIIAGNTLSQEMTSPALRQKSNANIVAVIFANKAAQYLPPCRLLR